MDGKIDVTERLKIARSVRVLETMSMVREAKMLEHLTTGKLIEVLAWCDIRNFLHYRYEGKAMVFVACAYLIPKFDASTCHIVPMKSEGDVLYIPWVISRSKDKTLPKQVIAEYLKEHPQVTQIVFYKGDSPNPTIYNRKGEQSGRQEQETGITANAELSAG